MTHGNAAQKRKILCRLLFLSALTLTGCTQEEKTMLLPMAQTSEEESESADPARDFTVKKIFTYAYETSDRLFQSAYLKGCGENQIRINAIDEKQDDSLFVCRQVDYRYGFYDVLGEFYSPPKEAADDAQDIESILPSPDGSRLLVYTRSVSRDTRMAWLYTMGSQDPRLLYEGIPEQTLPLTGSFSPDGRWATFDVKGASTGTDYMVPIYDCQKTESVKREEYLELQGDGKKKPSSGRHYSLLCPPDKTLSSPSNEYAQRPWAATLCDISGNPGLLNFFREEDKELLSFELQWDNISAADGGQNAPSEDIPLAIHRISSYLFHYGGISYLQYKVDNSKMRFFYMGNLYQLIQVDMESSSGLPAEKSFLFPDLVWDFLPLDTGDILVLLAQETGSNGPGETAYGGEWPTNENQQATYTKYMTDGTANPLSVHAYWGIRSADLYLYPAEGERRLLYKNVQNLLHMEYDAETRRILLETGEEGNLTQRKCIILELYTQ